MKRTTPARSTAIDAHVILDAIPAVIFVADARGGVEPVTPTDPGQSHIPPPEVVRPRVLQALAAGKSKTFEYFIAAGNEELWFEAVVSPIAEDRAVWKAHDITERKRVERELRRQLKFTETITATLGEGLYSLDRTGRMTYMNPAAEEALGWSLPELLGKRIHDIIHYQGQDGMALSAEDCPLLEALRTGRTVKVERDVFTRRDGTLFPVSYTASPIRSDAEVIGAVLVFHDISEREALEEQLRQSQKMEAIGQLAGGVAHDFNNLLTIINGYTGVLLSRHAFTEEARQVLREVREAGERAALLTQRLLAFSRRQVTQPRVVSLNAVTGGIEPILRRLLPESIQIAVRLDEACGRVRTDPAQVDQVLINLAINARDAMPGGGRLTIETAAVELDEMYAQTHAGITPGPYAMLAVTDTGCGMDEATQARIFEPFFTTKGLRDGTGLGLAVVYGVVRQSKGHVWVYSEPGKGTTFKIYLPAVLEPEDAAAPAPEAPAECGGSESILLVEDDDCVRTYAALALRSRGYEVIAASSTQEALGHAADPSRRIDLLLTDIVLPGMSGPALAAHVVRERPAIKVLYVSGYGDEAIVRNGLLGAGVPFLAKPFSHEALAQKAREALDAVRPRPVVMVVDDEAPIRAFARELLTAAGYDVLEAPDGHAAMTLIRERQGGIDLLITDLVMPNVTGIDITSELSREYPWVAVLYMSGYVDSIAMTVLSKQAPDAVLYKPFTEPELLEGVRRMISRRGVSELGRIPVQ